jgi:predicted nucleic acid binding AN1-type Zn finger protein
MAGKCHHGRCKKQVFIAGECRCGKMFCSDHRYPEVHECEKLPEIKEELRSRLEKKLGFEIDRFPNRI